MDRLTNWKVEFFAGAVGGVLSDGIVHPVDSARANLQTNKLYRNTFHALRSMTVKQMYRGFGIVGACSIPAHGLYFVGYETTKRLFPVGDDGGAGVLLDGSSSAVHFISGFSADVWGSLVWTPMDVVKQRMQVNAGSHRNSLAAVRSIVTEHGVAGLYKGYWASLATYGPFVGIYFAVYEKCKREYPVVESQFGPQVAAGAVAGLVAAAATNPLDVVKTNIQVSEGFGGNIFAALRKIHTENGVAGFWRGIGARIMWITPGCAITIAFYEQIKFLLGH